jgi:hypothetical protein
MSCQTAALTGDINSRLKMVVMKLGTKIFC